MPETVLALTFCFLILQSVAIGTSVFLCAQPWMLLMHKVSSGQIIIAKHIALFKQEDVYQ